MKITNFRGEFTDILAKNEALITHCPLQVSLAGHMAASSMVEVATSAHAISRQPVHTITKPIKQLASYFPVPARSPAAVLANGHSRDDGRVLTPLLPDFQVQQ